MTEVIAVIGNDDISSITTKTGINPTDKFKTEKTTSSQGSSSDPLQDEEKVIYTVHDVPSWRLSIVLALQHNLAMFSGAISVPYLISSQLCVGEGTAAQSILVSTTFFVSGIATFLQTLFGNRLPIIQGPSLSFLVPTIAILSQSKFDCPDARTLANVTSEQRDEMWMSRIREVQGAVVIASLVEVLIGLTGLIGFLMQWITPLAIVPTVTLIGLDLFTEAATQSSEHWGIAALTMLLLTVFSQYLADVNVPIFSCNRRNGCRTQWFPFFKVFPVTLTVAVAWGVCAVLTAAGLLPDDSKARSDLRLAAVRDADWIRIPYPGQFGAPVISAGPVLGVVAGVIASVVESVGDYYACARLSGAPPPPVHAINRGIFMEGLGCVAAGLFGTGSGLTSFSQNIGVIGITKVGSRRVIQFAAIITIVCGIVGKLGAVFLAIPSPVMGGIFCVTFGIVTAVGLSNLQFVNLNSSRNLFVVGFSIFMGLCLPKWLANHGDAVKTGNETADQIISILLKTGMFVGGFLGCILDNTIPGTERDRGVTRWRAETTVLTHDTEEVSKCYDLPYVMKIVKKLEIFKFIPISPTYTSNKISLHFWRRMKAKNATRTSQPCMSVTKL